MERAESWIGEKEKMPVVLRDGQMVHVDSGRPVGDPPKLKRMVTLALRLKGWAIAFTIFAGLFLAFGMIGCVGDQGRDPGDWMPLLIAAASFLSLSIPFWLAHGFAWAWAE
jgi:hypothetical protein